MTSPPLRPAFNSILRQQFAIHNFCPAPAKPCAQVVRGDVLSSAETGIRTSDLPARGTAQLLRVLKLNASFLAGRSAARKPADGDAGASSVRHWAKYGELRGGEATDSCA